MNCKNCGHLINGKFCSQCGQSSKVNRINFLTFISEITAGVFQVDRGFFYTLQQLTIRPGKSLQEFLDGKRKNHFKPIAYVLTLSTLYFLTTQVIDQNTWLDDLITGLTKGALGQESKDQLPEIITWFSKNFAYLTLLLIPMFSLASYISFSKFDKNYLEHVVINSYITGHQAIFYSAFAIGTTVIQSKWIEPLPFIIALLYTFWVFWQFFSKGNRVMNIFRSIATYVLYMLFSTLLLLLFMGIYEWKAP